MCVCVCHGACSSCVEEHTTALQRIQYHFHSVSVCRTKKEGSVCLSLQCHKALDLYTHTRAKAQPLSAPARRCSSDPLRECPITITYHHHQPSSFLFIDCVGAGLVQGLISVPLPTPHQLLVLDCRKHLLFPIHNYSTCTKHWVCFDFFSLWVIREKGKSKKREKLFRFKGSAVSKHFGLSRERVQKQRGNSHNL